MSESKINAVRQIMMNELGVTRESIRKELLEIVADQAKKLTNVILSDEQFIPNIVRRELNELLKENRWDRENLKTMVTMAAQAEATKFVRANISFNMNSDGE